MTEVLSLLIIAQVALTPMWLLASNPSMDEATSEDGKAKKRDR